nr:uncharacterized protein LOC120364255 [Saimiri boliviensis boliviensis]
MGRRWESGSEVEGGERGFLREGLQHAAQRSAAAARPGAVAGATTSEADVRAQRAQGEAEPTRVVRGWVGRARGAREAEPAAEAARGTRAATWARRLRCPTALRRALVRSASKPRSGRRGRRFQSLAGARSRRPSLPGATTSRPRRRCVSQDLWGGRESLWFPLQPTWPWDTTQEPRRDCIGSPSSGVLVPPCGLPAPVGCVRRGQVNCCTLHLLG